jgi:hypothetical protein
MSARKSALHVVVAELEQGEPGLPVIFSLIWLLLHCDFAMFFAFLAALALLYIASLHNSRDSQQDVYVKDDSTDCLRLSS